MVITHDLDEAIRIGHRIAIMKDGRIVQIGTPEAIVTEPADDYVSDFVAGISRLKLVSARTIMQPVAEYIAQRGGALTQAPRVSEDADLDRLIAKHFQGNTFEKIQHVHQIRSLSQGQCLSLGDS